MIRKCHYQIDIHIKMIRKMEAFPALFHTFEAFNTVLSFGMIPVPFL